MARKLVERYETIRQALGRAGYAYPRCVWCGKNFGAVTLDVRVRWPEKPTHATPVQDFFGKDVPTPKFLAVLSLWDCPAWDPETFRYEAKLLLPKYAGLAWLGGVPLLCRPACCEALGRAAAQAGYRREAGLDSRRENGQDGPRPPVAKE